MFASVFKHMVSISGIKMANTCFTFFLTSPRDVLSRGWWDGRTWGGCSECVLFCFAFYNSGSCGKAPRNVQKACEDSAFSIYVISPRNLLCLLSSTVSTRLQGSLAYSKALGAG